MSTPLVSVVIPVYNEQALLPQLFARLYRTLDLMNVSYEVIFVDDGSRDDSPRLLRTQYVQRPDVTRVILLAGNFGQHNALFAGFAQSRGAAVVTLDADLQNPPEEIPRIVDALRDGHDYVGTIRRTRKDPWLRSWGSKLLNRVREATTDIRLSDQGCMLRGYDRTVIDALNECEEVNSFIPALGYLYSRSPIEIEVRHDERSIGGSRYSLYKLIRLNFDLMTGFTLVPLQLYSVLGTLIAVSSLAFVVYLGIRRIIVGPEAAGVFTLFGIAFFLIGVILLGVGLLGEYIGRIYSQVRGRPRYRIAAVLQKPHESARSPVSARRDDT